MHLDLNSCFAGIEQQANPFLRGKPVAVAAYDTPSGCIIAPSIEAKKMGIKVGMKVKEGRILCPNLVVLTPDPWKYRFVHLKLRQLLGSYTDKITPKSIDEFVLDFKGTPAIKVGLWPTALEIKRRIKTEIGDWLTVSIGIAPNRFLAKTASNLHKPDGLDEINKNNFLKVYFGLRLTDLCGIKQRSAVRLSRMNIFTVLDFYEASERELKAAFGSIIGYYWYWRLRGWEIDEIVYGRKSFGNSYALPKPFSRPEELAPILRKLVEKTGARLRQAGFQAKGVHLAIWYRDNSFWHKAYSLSEPIFSSQDIYKEAHRLLCLSPYRKPVRNLAVSCFSLSPLRLDQLSLFSDLQKKLSLTQAIDKVNQRWGDFIITPARMLSSQQAVPDRIAFGGVRELEEAIIG